MKASLLARTAPTLFLAAALVGGIGTAAFAQTTSTTPGMAGSQVGATSAAPGSLTSNMPDNGALTRNSGNALTTPSAVAGSNGQQGTADNGQATADNTPPETLTQMADERIKDLHAELHITAKQESHWHKFADVMRGNAQSLDQAYQQRAADFQSMDAVQNMQSYARIEQMRANDVQKLVPAFRTLYASLTPAQKHDADTLFRARAEAAQQQHQATTAETH